MFIVAEEVAAGQMACQQPVDPLAAELSQNSPSFPPSSSPYRTLDHRQRYRPRHLHRSHPPVPLQPKQMPSPSRTSPMCDRRQCRPRQLHRRHTDAVAWPDVAHMRPLSVSAVQCSRLQLDTSADQLSLGSAMFCVVIPVEQKQDQEKSTATPHSIEQA